MILSNARMQEQTGKNTAAGALFDAFMYGRNGKVFGVQVLTWAALPTDHFIIVVGQRTVRIGPLEEKLNNNTSKPVHEPK